METKSEGNVVLKCEICGKELDTPMALKAHLQTQHAATATGLKNPR